jgi:hypothetical protein
MISPHYPFIRSAGCLTWDYVETEETHTEHTQTSMPQGDSNPRSQCWSGRRQFVPKTARPLRSALTHGNQFQFRTELPPPQQTQLECTAKVGWSSAELQRPGKTFLQDLRRDKKLPSMRITSASKARNSFEVHCRLDCDARTYCHLLQGCRCVEQASPT